MPSMAEDARSSDFSWQPTHKPPINEPEASGRNRSSLPSSSTPQRAAPTFSHVHTPRLQRLPTPSRPQPTMKVGARRVSSLPSHVPDAATLTSRSSTRPYASTRRREAKSSRRRRHQSRDDNPNATPLGRERCQWHLRRTSKVDRVFTLA